ncbi:tRNA 2-thiocytidine biosynthesis protein TtcA [Desulfamplus magnetovallimortis]|uniref:tRNA 2-thiocytidine biosynthesis protein TtcA n=1 Tax=Desulfamplus magnetovallimortis TaxID=1246637 RepID=A0A1W1HKF9_9BACT|nr:ATP-binding protein [Desulfamplus magnetovallimortis]SLM32964.1 tRNA 2-thiocytidine biosynthesis protein TtcA [Desulfamplus magnetovallimortis]
MKSVVKLKKINRAVGKAICDYDMIQDGDRIMVGVSGGKDSLALLRLLSDIRERAPVKFDLFPVYIDPGFRGSIAKDLESSVNHIHGRLRVDYTDYGLLAHSDSNRENPCFLCSRLRRKRLFEIASDEGCAKIALGHHKDDIIETLFINMCYSGRIGTMKPCQDFFGGELTIIRPLAYLEKSEILKLAAIFDFPDFVNPCPSDGVTKRSNIRIFLNNLYKENRNIKGNLFRAMANVEMDYLLKNTL